MNTTMWKRSRSTWQALELQFDAVFGRRMIRAGAETGEIIRRNRKGTYGIQAQICTFKRDNGIPED